MDGGTLDLLITAVAALLLVGLICGAALLFPISRRLAELLQLLIEERRQGATLDQGQVQRLREIVAAHDQRIATLTEQQEFVVDMLSDSQSREPLPHGGRETQP
jgi:hypothetical protein